MEILNFILALIVSFLGYPIGMFIANYTKEELKHGKKYFIILTQILVIIALIFFIYSIQLNIYLSIVIALALTVLFLKINPKPLIGYPLMTLFCILNIRNDSIFIILASIIFIYGLASSALKK